MRVPSHSAISPPKRSHFEGGLRAWHSGVVTTMRVYSSVPLAFGPGTWKVIISGSNRMPVQPEILIAPSEV
ncbi:hypothetical protein AHAS_Ahas15G0059900 [Arachis hypogaea]